MMPERRLKVGRGFYLTDDARLGEFSYHGAAYPSPPLSKSILDTLLPVTVLLF